MTKTVFLSALAGVLSVLLFAAAVSAKDDAVGAVSRLEGKVSIEHDGKKMPASAGTALHLHDIVATGPRARAELTFVDKTQLTLGEKARFKVEDYAFDPSGKSRNKATYGILEGAFQYVSGLLTKQKDHDVNIDTPYGNIGIRGTALWGGKIGGGYGVHVSEGHVVVTTGGGSVTLNAGEGTTLRGGSAPPTPPATWSAGKLAQALATVQFGGNSGKQGDNTPPDPNDLPSDGFGAPDLFTPEFGIPASAGSGG